MSVLIESVTAPRILQLINQFLSAADREWLNVQLARQEEEPTLSLQQKRELAAEVFGSWANDDSIPAIFQEIEEQRASSQFREVSFDATS